MAKPQMKVSYKKDKIYNASDYLNERSIIDDDRIVELMEDYFIKQLRTMLFKWQEHINKIRGDEGTPDNLEISVFINNIKAKL